jgi:hypothetical protein
MNRYRLLLVIGFGFSLLSCSFTSAQVSSAPGGYQNWFGIKTGYINSSYPFGLLAHFGVRNPAGADLRISGSYQPGQGGSSLGVGVDVLRTFNEVRGLSVYGGGGGSLIFGAASFLADLHGLVGTEYRLVAAQLDELGFFLEVQLGAALAIGNIAQPAVPNLGAVIGINIHF